VVLLSLCMGVVLPGFLLFGWMRDLRTVIGTVDNVVVPQIKDSVSISLKTGKPVLIFGNRTGGYDEDPDIQQKRDFIQKVDIKSCNNYS